MQHPAAASFVAASILSTLAFAGAAHPPLVGDWARHMHCPFADTWLKHGPVKAAALLNLTESDLVPAASVRSRRATECVDTLASTPSPIKDCAILIQSAPCGTTSWGATINEVCAKTCGVCDGDGAQQTQSSAGAGEETGPVNFDGGVCAIAPGPMGAAHQLATAPGYAADCKDTPAEGSKYQWPLRWTAETTAQSMAFGSDEAQYSSKGKVFYRLDLNWKRYDIYSESGVLRAIGQVPCETPEEDGANEFGCDKGNVERNMSTVLHRGKQMFFINWNKEQTKVTSCSWMDLQIIGNIRPDWFMDKRGVDTDVQYIGDSHVYYEQKPRLVKQWRKKDFANQYFTMSMQRLPGADGVHWPLILNIPGEGFGDDQLQHYSNHKLLGDTEADRALFLLDETFVANGGECPQVGSDSAGGPPTSETVAVPSNLEKQAESWRSIEFTESPVWKSDAASASCGAGDGADANAGVQQVVDGLSVYSCFDEATQTLTVDATFDVDSNAPGWTAIGFLEDEECLMTPRNDGSTPVVYAAPDDANGGGYTAKFNRMARAVKTFDASTAQTFVDDLAPLSATQLFSNSGVEYDSTTGKVTVSFDRDYTAEGTPEVVHLSFGIGNGPNFAYHKSRGCFALTAEHLKSCSTRGPSMTPSETIADLEQRLAEEIQTCAERRLRQKAGCSGFGSGNGCNGQDVCCSGTCRASQCASWEILGANAEGTLGADSAANAPASGTKIVAAAIVAAFAAAVW